MGSLGIITAIIRFASFYPIDLESDPTWYSTDLFSYTMIAPSAYFMCSCFAGVRPLGRALFKKMGLGTKKGGSYNSPGQSARNDIHLRNIKGSHMTSILASKPMQSPLDDDDDRSHFIRLNESVDVDVSPAHGERHV
ncbi:hypothetical protein MAJ_10586, partial [Metarhizium majus ARSEF 297]